MTLFDPRPVPGGEAALLPRADVIESLPLLILFPHARCNCRCVMCDIWKVKEPSEITAAQVASWAADLARLGTRRVVLSGGEALMHSHLWALVATLRAAGISITLLTSGLLLARHASSIAAEVDDLVVSLDGPPDVHDAVRNVPRAFARLAEGVGRVRALAPGLSITARCTVQRANAGRLLETARAARAIGCSRVSFLAADVAPGDFRRDAAAPQLVPDDLALLEAQIDALCDEMPPEFLAEDRAKLRRILLDHFRAVAGEAPFPPRVCNAPFVSAVVESDGTVRPCFFHAPVGNVNEAGGLGAALNSPRAVAFRRGLDVATDPVCRRCVCSLALREDAGQKGAELAGSATTR